MPQQPCRRQVAHRTAKNFQLDLFNPDDGYYDNSAWQQLVALTHNLLTNFQIDTGAERRRRSRKHTALPRLATVQTLRFTLFHRAAAFVRPRGRAILRLTNNPATERLFTRIERTLPRAA